MNADNRRCFMYLRSSAVRQNRVSFRLRLCRLRRDKCLAPALEKSERSGWRGPMDEEKTIWEGSSSQWVNFPIYLLCGVLSVLVVPLIYGIARWIQNRCRRY